MTWKSKRMKSPQYFHGQHKPEAEQPRQMLYLTPESKYARAYGPNIFSYDFDPDRPLDLRLYSNKPVSYRTLKAIFEKAGIDIDGIVPEDYQTGVAEPIWFWIIRYKEIVDRVKPHGYDSILLVESHPAIRGKYESAIVLDPKTVFLRA